MTLDDLRELVRVTAAEHGDTSVSIARTLGLKDRVGVWRWMQGTHVHHWPDWVSTYLESRGIVIVVRRSVAQNATARKNT